MGAKYRGPVELEMDCKDATDMLNAPGVPRSPHYGIIHDIKEALSRFASHKITFVGRNATTLHTKWQRRLD